MLESKEQIVHFLEQHHDFAECVLDEVCWHHHGTIIDLVFEYIWTDEASVRPAHLPSVQKTLRFHVVQEFHVCNGLTVDTSLRPDALNWGLSEVAVVRLLDEETFLVPYSRLPVPVHHLRCLWEGERKIDLVFSTLEVL